MKENQQKQTPGFLKSSSDILKSIDSFFQDAFRSMHQNGMFTSPIPISTFETDSEFIIEAELPGVKKEQISLDVYPNYIRIGIRHEEIMEEKNDNLSYVSKQYTTQSRERIIPIPSSITHRDVKAKYQNGLLTITVPNRRQTINIE